MGNKGKGFKNLIISVVWVLVVIGGLLAVFQGLDIKDGESAVAYIRRKSDYYLDCIPSGTCGLPDIIENVKPGGGSTEGPGKENPDSPVVEDGNDVFLDRNETPGYEGPAKGIPYITNAGLITKETAARKLEELETVSDKVDEVKDVGYSRKEWKHWAGIEGRPCWNTREEILYRDAVPGSVKLIDKNKQPTENYEEACGIGKIIDKNGKMSVDTKNSGVWIDPYSGKEITDARKIDIDHVIPLSNAARNGGQSWSEDKKKEFANDPDNLLATSAGENRSKGDKGPGKYMPLQKSRYRCAYSKTYVYLSKKYDLTITDSDYKVLSNNIASCPN